MKLRVSDRETDETILHQLLPARAVTPADTSSIASLNTDNCNTLVHLFIWEPFSGPPWEKPPERKILEEEIRLFLM